jgi:hypothetical protein
LLHDLKDIRGRQSFHRYARDLGNLGWYIGEHDRLMAPEKIILPWDRSRLRRGA